MTPLILALLTQIVIPEVSAIIRAHYNATGKLPTDAEIIAALGTNAAGVVSVGEAWLAAHPPTA